jgi:hypothetical protein
LQEQLPVAAGTAHLVQDVLRPQARELLGLQSSISAMRCGAAASSAGNALAGSCPDCTRPTRGSPESSASKRAPTRQRGRNW